VGPVFAGGDREESEHAALPSAHSDAEEILRGAGFSDDEVRALRRENAVA
jgi:hypothetical protein